MKNFMLIFVLTQIFFCEGIFEKDNKLIYDRVLQNRERVKEILQKTKTLKEKMITDYEILDVYIQKKIHQFEQLVKLKEKQKIEKTFNIVINTGEKDEYREKRIRQLHEKIEQLKKLKSGEEKLNPYTEEQQQTLQTFQNKSELKKVRNEYNKTAKILQEKKKQLKMLLGELTSIEISQKKLQEKII